MAAGVKLQGDARDELGEGGDGDDVITGGGGADIMRGHDGNDKIYSGLKYDPATGLWGHDDKGDLLDGGNGDDDLQGETGNDTLLGGAGNDDLYGGGGSDILDGGPGDDLVRSGKRWDPVTKQHLPDLMGDKLDGGDGNDRVFGEDGNDLLLGGLGDDLLVAGSGSDILLGGAGDDILEGGDGNDTLDGGSGSNLLLGGQGDDNYHVRSVADLVADEGGNDRGMIYADWVLPVTSVEHWSWAPGVQKLPNWIAALAAKHAAPRMLGNTWIVEYRFAEQPGSDFSDKDKDGFQPFNDAQRSFARKVFDYVGTVLNVKFVETDKVEESGILVLANNRQEDSSGYASARRLMLSTEEPDNLAPTAANYGVEILLHELGHSLGLKHPFSHTDSLGNAGPGPYLSSAEDAARHTVMTYNMDEAELDLAYSALDLAALHYIYGPSQQLAAGDTTWTLDASRANFIADGGGIDTIDGSAFGGGMTLDLRPAYWSHLGKQADSIVAAGQVTVNFGSVIENLRGGAGNDTLIGSEIANRIEGGAGNDVIAGGLGGDLLDGGPGLDLALYAGKRADYQLGAGKDGTTVRSLRAPDEVDVLTGIERLKFDDAMLALDVDGVAGQAYRLYQAAFNRTPDLAGLGYWIGRMDGGTSLTEVAAAFIGSQEFAQMYGAAPGNADFLGKIYQNILHRAPDQAGFDYWLKAMEAGTSATDILAQFSESQENVAALAGVLQDGIAYTPFA